MKTLSLKLDDKTFDEAEEITSKLQLARNRYINEAVSIYNLFNKRRLLKKQLTKESKRTMTLTIIKNRSRHRESCLKSLAKKSKKLNLEIKKSKNKKLKNINRFAVKK